MFCSRDVWMVFRGAKLTVVEDDRGVEHRMAECQLVLDPQGRQGHKGHRREGRQSGNWRLSALVARRRRALQAVAGNVAAPEQRPGHLIRA